MAFKTWYGGDKTQSGTDWLWLDQDLNVAAVHDSEKKKNKPLKEIGTFPAGRAHDVTAESVTEAVALITADKGYPSAEKMTDNAWFTAQAAWVAQGKPPMPQGKPQALFGSGAGNAPTGTSLTVSLSDLPPSPVGAAAPEDDDPAKWPWRVRLGLTTDFLQAEYAAHQGAPTQTVTLITRQTTKQLLPVLDGGVYKMKKVTIDGKDILLPVLEEKTFTTDTPVPVVVPKAQWQAPYLPQWSGVRIDYQAEEKQPQQQVLTPFGYAPQDESATQSPAQAEVYVGIDGIEAGQLLTLHWQLKSPQALPLEWQYLTPGERWARLPVQDDTDAFQGSGGWSVTWPGDASRTATSLPAGRMWLRGRARHVMPVTPDAVAIPTTPWLTGLVTNAGTATLLTPEAIAADHFATGLLAGRVTQALSAPAAVQEVTQPWPSSAGQAAETSAVFEARVARRLRHRERALNNHDVMTLLREQHPGLRELAVLPPVREDTGTLQQTVVVMPGRALSDSEDVQRPGLSEAHRTAMAAQLKTTASPWLTLTCVNPDYRPVSVCWDVEVAPGLSLSVVDARVRAALDAAFMPWATDEGEDATPTSGAIGRPLTHGALRDVVRRVPGVAAVNQVYLNGEVDKAPVMGPAQVAILHCVPREYNRLTLAWMGPQQARFGAVTLVGDGIERATVRVTLPAQVEGLGAQAIATADADVYLVDLDSGARLPETAPAGPGVWATRNDVKTPPVVWDRACYADPLGAAPEVRSGTVTERAFTVVAGAGTAGVIRLGVAVGLKVDKVPDAILQSAVVGECVTCRVQDSASAALWRESARWAMTAGKPVSLPAPADWTATLTTYTYALTDLSGLARPLRFTAPAPLAADALKTRYVDEKDGTALRPLTAAGTPHAVVGGKDKDKGVTLWYVDPTPAQAMGLDVGSAFAKTVLPAPVSFTPAARTAQQLTVYALHLTVKDNDIGKTIQSGSQTCPVTRTDAGIWDGRADTVTLTLATGTPVAAVTLSGWAFTQHEIKTIQHIQIKDVTVKVIQHLLCLPPGLTAVRHDADALTKEVLKNSSMPDGKGGLLLKGTEKLTAMSGHAETEHLWWVMPAPKTELGLAKNSAIGTVSLGTEDIVFTVPSLPEGQLAVYEMQVTSSLSTDKQGEKMGTACKDHPYPAMLTVSGGPAGDMTMTVGPLGNEAPGVTPRPTDA